MGRTARPTPARVARTLELERERLQRAERAASESRVTIAKLEALQQQLAKEFRG